MRLTKSVFLLAVFVLILLVSVPVLAADVSPADGYDDNDYDKIQSFLNMLSDDGVRTNGQILNAAYNGNDPTTWSGVTWNAAASARVTDIYWYEERDLAGSLDLSGFTALTNVEVGVNAITSLNVSGNTALGYLGCHYNDITSLDVSTLTNLDELDCRGNALTSIDVSSNLALDTLDCAFNSLTSLSVATNTQLTTLYCQNNTNLSAVTVNGATNLQILDASFGSLSSINVNNNTALTDLSLSGNDLSSINVSALTLLSYFVITNNSLSTIDVSSNLALDTFSCGGNNLTSVDVTNNTLLTYLLFSYNSISSIDLTQNALLEYLYADSNDLTTLNTTTNPNIIDIYAGDNSIVTVNIAGNTALSDLRLKNNNLSSISLGTNTGLTYLDVQNNNLSTLAPTVSTLLHTIHGNDNVLTSINLSANSALVTLNLQDNNLTTINVSGSPLLTALRLNDNSLGTITLTGNTLLTTLYLHNNNLTGLDATACPSLTILQALGNPMRQIDADINGADISVSALGLGTVGLTFHNLISRLYVLATPNPTFAFSDWTDDGTSTQVSTDTQYDLTFGSNYDISANFSAGVIFDENGGDTPANPSSMAASVGSTISAPGTPPGFTGLIFDGWYKEPACINAWDFATDVVPPSGLLTLYAKWAGTFTVSFNVNGGDTPYSPTSEDVDYGNPATEPGTDPTRTGYGFTGWFTDAATTNAWNFADPVLAPMTLYAGWNANPHIVTYNENGGETQANPVSETVFFDALIPSEPIPPTLTGFGFAGWYTELALTNQWDFANDTISGDMTLYARWGSFYTVTYDNTSGDTEAVPSSEVVLEDQLIPLAPVPPTQTGYVFDGWFKEVTLINEWDFATDVVTGHTTLYARWRPEEYTVTFDRNGGDTDAVPASAVAYYGFYATAPATEPTRVGHNFTGWFKEPAATNAWNFATETVRGDMTLYAGWDPITYTVTFDENGGSVAAIPGTMGVVFNTLIPSQPTAPIRAGYALDAWCTDVAGNNAWDFATDVITVDTTLYAKWAVAYTVTFNNNGGDTEASPQTLAIIDGHLISPQPTPPARVGYTFSGWYTTAAAITEWDFATNVVASDTTLFAGWSPRPYTITYDENGGDTAPAPATTTAYYDSLITVTPTTLPTLAGFIFDAWYVDAATTTPWDFATDTVAGNTTLYADYVPFYTVTYDENGGDTGASPSTQDIPQGRTIDTLPAEPTRVGYVFDAWYVDALATTLWDFDTDTVGADLTLYAGWTRVYDVTFDDNGGDTAAIPANAQVADGSTVSAPSISPTRAGYAFGGWYTSAVGGALWVFATDVVTTNQTLYAHWLPLDYTVTFDENGGDSLAIPGTMMMAYDMLIDPEPTPPIRAGYAFSGWYTDAATTNQWDFAIDTISGDLTLYAGWASSYTVDFHRNTGNTDAVPETMGVLSGDLIDPAPTPPTKTGYTFTGWYRDSAATLVWNFATHAVSGDMTLYAGWTPETYTVTFDENGGDSAAFPVNMTVNYGDLIAPEPADPGLTGSAFAGWYANAATTLTWDFATNLVTEDLTLYARYTPLQTVTFDENGGDTAAVPGTMQVGLGLTIATPPTPPTQNGFVFVGWFTDAAMTNPWTLATDTVSADVTLYAGWTTEVHTITFNGNGGTVVLETVDTPNGAIISPVPQDPTRSGHVFEGWYQDAAGTLPWDFDTDTVDDDTTLYASWSEALALSGSPSSGDIYEDGRIEITPNISGGTWSYNPEDVSVEYIGSTAVFTGVTEGETTVTYTVDGQTAQYTITVSNSALPTTGQSYTLLFVLLGLMAAVGISLAVLTIKTRVKV